MRVLLVRHAAAVSHGACASDDDRWLTIDGRAEARRVGGALAELGVRFDRVLTSPLVRAVQTAELLSAATRFEGAVEALEALAFDRGTTALALAPLETTPDDALVVLVTHEPKIRAMAGHLVGERTFPGFATAGACLVDLPERRIPGRFEWMLDPRTLRCATRLDAIR